VQLNRHALQAIRQRSGLTVSGLARRAGVSQPHLSNVERGRRHASPDLIVRLAAALRVPLVALLAQVDEPDTASEHDGEDGELHDEPDDEPEPGRLLRTRSSPGPGCRRRHLTPAQQQQQGRAMQPPTTSRRPAPPADVQVRADGAPAARRRLGLAAVGLASAGAVLAGAAPAQAETYYTGQCAVSTSVGAQTYYRAFQARISGNIEDGTGKYAWVMYDYKYTVDSHLTWGGSSDEEVTFVSGYSDGLSNPWHSPDNHGTSGDWIQEANWKGAKSYWGSTRVKFYAAFDIPGTPDPHCNAYTGTV